MKRFTLLIAMLLGLLLHAHAYHWDVNINLYPNNMSVIGVVQIDGVEQTTSTIEVGAFSGDECRGREMLTDAYYSTFNHYFVFLTVYGNDGDPINFRLYDHATGEELDGYCNNTTTFVTNNTLGDPITPYVFDYTNTSSGYHWDVNIYQYPNSMTFCGIINIDGVEQFSEELEIGAFSGDECRGREKPVSQYFSIFNHYFLFMTVYGNDGDPITFRLYDHSTNQELDLDCSTTVNFATNATLGDPNSPYAFNFFSQSVSYTISATANPTNGGSITGTGSYQSGSLCTLTATANSGYSFSNWTENGEEIATSPTLSFTVTGNRSLVANFVADEPTPTEYHWDVNIHTYPSTMTVMGIVNIDGVEQFSNFLEIGAFCGDECRGRERTSDNYYNIINHYVVFLTIYGNDGDQLTFRLYDHSIGEELDLNCITIMNFEVNGSYGNPADPFPFNFVSAIYHDVTAEANPSVGGTVEGSGSYEENTQCTLTAIPNTGYRFVNWTHDGVVVSASAEYTFVVTEETHLVANFELKSYEITAETNPTEGGSVSGAGTYNHFQTCTLTATANTGYTFEKWTNDGETVSTQNTITFTVEGAAHYVAHFNLNSYTITATADPTTGGSISGTDTYYHFETCTLTAIPAVGYHFVNWTNDANITVPNELEISFEVTGPVNFVAHFELNSYTITVEAHPTNGGTAVGGGTFIHGTTCTLTATPDEQFNFSNWTKDGVPVYTDMVYTFTVTEGGTYVANFERITVTQTTEIYSGWNWYSTYIEQDDIDGLQMLEESLGDIGQRIKAQDGNYQENYSGLWWGLLSELTNEDSYQILATGTGVISMTGPVVHPSDHPITLYPGWNWIGYPCIGAMDIATAFSNLTPTENDQVKIADLYANYYQIFGGWFGFLQVLEPGMGFLYHSRNTQPVTFTYPEVDERYTPTVRNAVSDDNHWFVDRHAYPNNMTISAIVELDGEELSSDHYELAVFADGECRGSVKLTYFEPLNRYLALLVVSGDETTSLQFGLYNSENEMEYYGSDFISYTTNTTLGTPMEPFKVAFQTNTGMDEFSSTTNLYPNPVESGKSFSIGTSTESEIQVEIINTIGSVIRVENMQQHPAKMTAPNVAGIYTLKITSDGKTCYKKLIVK